MTIESIIAKNGVEMYYRVDAKGKKHHISAVEGIFAYARQQREQEAANNNVNIAALKNATVEYKPQCTWDNPHDYETVGANHARNVTYITEPATVEETAPTVVADDVYYIATQITYPTGHEGEPTREVSKTFYYLDDAAKFIADENPFVETETGCRVFAYDDYYFGGVFFAGWRIEATDGRLICRVDNNGVYGDQDICALVDKYIDQGNEESPAPVETATIDDFTAKLYQFKAKQDAAKANELTKSLITDDIIYAEGITIVTQGGEIFNKPQISQLWINFIDDARCNGNFSITANWDGCYAVYDTPAQIEDSLTRAMETALEYYKGFCHTGNLTAAENELKLYNICRKATRELLKE